MLALHWLKSAYTITAKFLNDNFYVFFFVIFFLAVLLHFILHPSLLAVSFWILAIYFFYITKQNQKFIFWEFLWVNLFIYITNVLLIWTNTEYEQTISALAIFTFFFFVHYYFVILNKYNNFKTNLEKNIFWTKIITIVSHPNALSLYVCVYAVYADYSLQLVVWDWEGQKYWITFFLVTALAHLQDFLRTTAFYKLTLKPQITIYCDKIKSMQYIFWIFAVIITAIVFYYNKAILNETYFIILNLTVNFWIMTFLIFFLNRKQTTFFKRGWNKDFLISQTINYYNKIKNSHYIFWSSAVIISVIVIQHTWNSLNETYAIILNLTVNFWVMTFLIFFLNLKKITNIKINWNEDLNSILQDLRIFLLFFFPVLKILTLKDVFNYIYNSIHFNIAQIVDIKWFLFWKNSFLYYLNKFNSISQNPKKTTFFYKPMFGGFYLLPKMYLINKKVSLITPTIWFYKFYLSLKTVFLPFILCIVLTTILISYFSIIFFKQLAVWCVIGYLIYWLFSGFNFFLKRYRFGKFTSAIQRFWKRTNSYFWILEGFLFFLFFYYYLNAAQEPLYMYDEASLQQFYLNSLTVTYKNYLMLLLIIFILFYLIFNINLLTIFQIVIYLLFLTLLFTFIYLLETYQVYYYITFFLENYIIFDRETNLWNIENESPRVKIKQQYLLIALVVKYWHFVFIYISWIFVVMKTFEKKSLSYNFAGLILQNSLLLFLLNILFSIQWVKWLFKRYFETIYYWFFSNYNNWIWWDLLYEVIINVAFTFCFE